MIWQIDKVDSLFIEAFENVGEPDQAVIDAYVAKQAPRRRHQQEKPGVKRWYYLLKDNPRVRLVCLGMPLEEWSEAAFIIVGTSEIIGEFSGNSHLVGKKGLQLKMQPLQWMQGEADALFLSGSLALAEISEQILDLAEIERSQQRTQQKYQWRKQGD